MIIPILFLPFFFELPAVLYLGVWFASQLFSEMPEGMLHLMQLYPQPTRRQPSVEYVPLPYRSGRPGSRARD